MVTCPTCGGTTCIDPADDVLDSLYQIYMACPKCQPEPGWKKHTALADQPGLPALEHFDAGMLRCTSCGRRPLDAVMAHALSIMMEHGDRNNDAGLSQVGTPLIARGFPIMYPPRLGPDSIVLITDSIGQATAEDIVNRVPEVRGVVLRHGGQAQSVGILDSGSSPHEYTLLAGCDMRCDVAQTAFGELVIYKSQSKIHIEFDNRHKMDMLGKLDREGLLAGKVVVDGLCGPGTLGLMAMLAGACKVVFNDAWRPAIENVLLNIEVNKALLGADADLEVITTLDVLPLVGDEPVLVARVMRERGRVAAEVYFGDLRKLAGIVEKWDVCLIDAFPAMETSALVNTWTAKHPGGNVVVV
ncbi:MAG: methyltransferase [ANME-2 cluster archaeon]|nr:methyltransferase [ANME-2 cluster archaeon]